MYPSNDDEYKFVSEFNEKEFGKEETDSEETVSKDNDDGVEDMQDVVVFRALISSIPLVSFSIYAQPTHFFGFHQFLSPPQ